MAKRVAFEDLSRADLVVDATYQGGTTKDVRSDPIARLLPCGNQGGIRGRRGSRGEWSMAVLFSSFADADWPDTLAVESGQLTYYGDNKSPGRELHDTPKLGNKLFKDCFDAVHSTPARRDLVPPFFVFARTAGWDVRFCGLAVPGVEAVTAANDLVAVWKTKEGSRFQNYRGLFTILDVATISRGWVDDLAASKRDTANAPGAWRQWATVGTYKALRAPRSREHRKRGEQVPTSGTDREMIGSIHSYFKDDPFRFEGCAVKLARMLDPKIIDCELTRRWVDGGRDAVGTYKIGGTTNGVQVEFALEAKCYGLSKGVGVEDTSRLISRLRFRQFGIFVTTSFVSEQAYKEIIQDGHPVIILSAVDIVGLLKTQGITTAEGVVNWLEREFPVGAPEVRTA